MAEVIVHDFIDVEMDFVTNGIATNPQDDANAARVTLTQQDIEKGIIEDQKAIHLEILSWHAYYYLRGYGNDNIIKIMTNAICKYIKNNYGVDLIDSYNKENFWRRMRHYLLELNQVNSVFNVKIDRYTNELIFVNQRERVLDKIVLPFKMVIKI